MSDCVPRLFRAHQRLLANSCASWRWEASCVPAGTLPCPSGSPRCSLLDPSKVASHSAGTCSAQSPGTPAPTIIPETLNHTHSKPTSSTHLPPCSPLLLYHKVLTASLTAYANFSFRLAPVSPTGRQAPLGQEFPSLCSLPSTGPGTCWDTRSTCVVSLVEEPTVGLHTNADLGRSAFLLKNHAVKS